MDFHWYETVRHSSDIAQGDIMLDCLIPLPDKELFKALLENKEELGTSLEIIEADIIVLSQTCDILNDKIDSLVICPIWPLKTIMKNNEYYRASNSKESLRQGKEPAYHLLNEHSSERISFEFSVVDFHRIYSLPKDYVKSIAENTEIRLRLMPPYREHLSSGVCKIFYACRSPNGY